MYMYIKFLLLNYFNLRNVPKTENEIAHLTFHLLQFKNVSICIASEGKTNQYENDCITRVFGSR